MSLIATYKRHYAQRPLVAHFLERELRAKYSNTLLSVVWPILTPILLLAIYTIVFENMFKQSVADRAYSYTLFLAAALWPWMMFADSLNRSLSAIHGNAALIKKVAFPTIYLVFAVVAATFIVHLLGFLVVLGALSLSGAPVAWVTIISLTPLLIALFVFTFGICAAASAVQTIMKDLEHLVPPALMALYFLTPIMYPLSQIPVKYQGIFASNPLGYLVERSREIITGSALFKLTDIALLVAAALIAALGIALFERLAPHFEDFL
jgi:lipopolysaccharide transport system permease protein